MRRDEALLIDILQAAQLAVHFKKMGSRAQFFRDKLRQSGVIHQLITVGEAVKRLSRSFTEAHPEIPWKLVAGMRDRLTHGYFDIDLEEVWRTVEVDLPELIRCTKRLTPHKEAVKKSRK